MSQYDDDADRLSDECDLCGMMNVNCHCYPVLVRVERTDIDHLATVCPECGHEALLANVRANDGLCPVCEAVNKLFDQERIEALEHEETDPDLL